MCALRAIDTRLAILGGKPVRNLDRYLAFGRPAIGEVEIAEVLDTLRSGWIGTGPKVARFESAAACSAHAA